ncbi:hypothetical protein NDU88_000198 [Pleurodeles waltl]|uniref:Uncharacterized protein n=1 Tax=Pleurodeles waltl TaxID=8319 RepID=A0AAV7P7M5_PLEWA|nr:hypothetical protein NDU88_000198 [Pleurodeles waltl]
MGHRSPARAQTKRPPRTRHYSPAQMERLRGQDTDHLRARRRSASEDEALLTRADGAPPSTRHRSLA